MSPPPYTGPMVSCAGCPGFMPAPRLKLVGLRGLCSDCLSAERTARPPAPMYETEAWSRGIRL